MAVVTCVEEKICVEETTCVEERMTVVEGLGDDVTAKK